MSSSRSGFVMVLVLSTGLSALADSKVLFDFEDAAAVKAWSNANVYALREAEVKAAADARSATNAAAPAYKPPASIPSEPPVQIEQSTENAPAGQHSFKLTFAGGRMPTVSIASPLADWTPYKTFRAEVTASRTCMVVFRAMNETSKYGVGYNEGCSRWEKAARVEAGKNTVLGATPAYKNVTTFQIYMYNPRKGESIFVDNIALSSETTTGTAFNSTLPPPAGKYKVSGTDLDVRDVDDLADQLKDKWVKPDSNTVEQVEADIQAEYQKIKAAHPKAVLAILRDGQKGYDPANPDKPFAGWEDAGTPSHLPMSLTLANFSNSGKSDRMETCFRNRPGFLRVDLTAIPKGADILAARLIVVRGVDMGPNWQTKPTMFAAEPCNRPWKEYEVNVFEYAKDLLWKEYAADTWGEGGDCDAVLLAHGPSGGTVSSWDFSHAVRYWTDGKHANNGFILYGSPKYVDYLNICTRESGQANNRPAVAVVYEPKE